MNDGRAAIKGWDSISSDRPDKQIEDKEIHSVTFEHFIDNYRVLRAQYAVYEDSERS